MRWIRQFGEPRCSKQNGFVSLSFVSLSFGSHFVREDTRTHEERRECESIAIKILSQNAESEIVIRFSFPSFVLSLVTAFCDLSTDDPSTIYTGIWVEHRSVDLLNSKTHTISLWRSTIEDGPAPDSLSFSLRWGVGTGLPIRLRWAFLNLKFKSIRLTCELLITRRAMRCFWSGSENCWSGRRTALERTRMRTLMTTRSRPHSDEKTRMGSLGFHWISFDLTGFE